MRMKINICNISGWWLVHHPFEKYATVKVAHLPRDPGGKLENIIETTTYYLILLIVLEILHQRKPKNSAIKLPNSTGFFRDVWSFSPQFLPFSLLSFQANSKCLVWWERESEVHIEDILTRYHGNLRVSNFTPFPTNIGSSKHPACGPLRFP